MLRELPSPRTVDGLDLLRQMDPGRGKPPPLLPPYTYLEAQNSPAQVAESDFYGNASTAIYADQSTPVKFRLETGNYGYEHNEYLILYSSKASGSSLSAPCPDMKKPMVGLLSSEHINIDMEQASKAPAKGSSGKQDDDLGLPKGPGFPGSKEAALTAHSGTFTLVLPDAVKKTLQPPATFYIRLIPVKGSGDSTCVKPPSNWVSIHIPGTKEFVETEVAKKAAAAKKAQRAAELAAKRAEIEKAYTVKILSYIPPKFYDDRWQPNGRADEYMIMTHEREVSAGRVWFEGCSFHVPAAVNMVNNANATFASELWDLTEATINMTSEAYESAKQFVVVTIANGITATGVYQCEQECQAYLKQGLEMALAYCGIPPNIPNTSQLYGQGLEYLATNLAEMAVEQTIGLDVPSEPGKAAIYKAEKQAIYQASYNGAKEGINALIDTLGCPDPAAPSCGVVAENPYTWGTPDPYYRRHPAFMYFRITRSAQAGAENDKLLSLNVAIEGGAFKGFKIPIGDLAPGKSIVLPVALWPEDATQWKEVGRLTEFDCYTGSILTCGQPLYQAPKMKLTVRTIHKTQIPSQEGSEWLAVEWPKPFNAVAEKKQWYMYPNMSGGLVLDGEDGDPKSGASGITLGKNYYGEITSRPCP